MAVFTDGVLAISATFTLLEIRAPASTDTGVVPPAPPPSGESPFIAFVRSHWTDIASYASSFATVMMLWVTHRDIASALPRYGGCLRGINLAACAFAALIPFGMSLRQSFPGELVAETFAIAVVLLASGSMAAVACCARWLVRDPRGLPPLMLASSNDEDEDDGEGQQLKRRQGGGSRRPSDEHRHRQGRGGGGGRRWVEEQANRQPGVSGQYNSTSEEDDEGGSAAEEAGVRAQQSLGDASYYGFLVEDDPTTDGKTDGKAVAKAVATLRRARPPPQEPLFDEDEDEDGDGDDNDDDGGDDDRAGHTTMPTTPQPPPVLPASSAAKGTRATSAVGNGGSVVSVRGRVVAASSPGSVEGSNVGLAAALLVPMGGGGGYTTRQLTAELEEHLLRLMVARASAMPLVAAFSLLALPWLPWLPVHLLWLTWPLVGAIGWAEHSLRSTLVKPWLVTRVLLCWTGRGRALPGLGTQYTMHQGPLCCLMGCRRARAVVCCDASQDMDHPMAPTATAAVGAAALAHDHEDATTLVGAGVDGFYSNSRGWNNNNVGLPALTSQGSLNADETPVLVTELSSTK